MRTFALAAAALAASSAAPAMAQDAPHQEMQREVRIVEHPAMMQGPMLSIAAEGVVQGKPDMATIALGVQTDGQTAAAALSANAARMNALMAAVRRAGVAERDVQTANVSLNPQYVYVENQPPRLTGYQAMNTVSVRVRNTDNVGRVIDASVSAGGNTVNGVSFSYQNPDEQLDAARRDAMTEAQRIANLYATAAGLHIDHIVSISEGAAAPPPSPMYPVMARMAAEAAPTPIAAGELETRVSVNVVYALR